MKSVKKKGGKGKALAVGAGLVAAGAAAYMLLGPNGKKNRAKVKTFVSKVKTKVSQSKQFKKASSAVKKVKSVAKKAVKKLKK